MRYLYLLCILLLFACKDNKHFELYPSDHFYLQRAYPYGEIDRKAYSSAVRWKSKMIVSSQYKNQASWHQKGPFNLDGRITDIEVHPQDDQILYAGSASGSQLTSMPMSASCRIGIVKMKRDPTPTSDSTTASSDDAVDAEFEEVKDELAVEYRQEIGEQEFLGQAELAGHGEPLGASGA